MVVVVIDVRGKIGLEVGILLCWLVSIFLILNQKRTNRGGIKQSQRKRETKGKGQCQVPMNDRQGTERWLADDVDRELRKTFHLLSNLPFFCFFKRKWVFVSFGYKPKRCFFRTKSNKDMKWKSKKIKWRGCNKKGLWLRWWWWCGKNRRRSEKVMRTIASLVDSQFRVILDILLGVIIGHFRVFVGMLFVHISTFRT